MKFRIDGKALAKEQVDLLDRHAGSRRAAWNWALALHNEVKRRIDAGVRARAAAECDGSDEGIAAKIGDAAWRKAAYRAVRAELGSPNLGAFTLSSLFTIATSPTAEIPEKVSARVPGWVVDLVREPELDPATARWSWWRGEKHGVNRFAVTSAFQDLDRAVKRYFEALGKSRERWSPKRPRKDGMPDGWPRFARFQDEPRFAIYNVSTRDFSGDPVKLDRFLPGGRKLRVPSIGTVRVHGGTLRLRRLLRRTGGRPTQARFSRVAGHWYLALFLAIPAGSVPTPQVTARQRRGGAVGVDLGVTTLATLSTGERVENTRIGRRRANQKAALQRQLSLTERPARGEEASGRRKEARARLARFEHRTALEREARTHELTKRLATEFQLVGIEDLSVRGMLGTPEPKPDPEREGAFLPNGRAAKAGLNREISDVQFGEFRRQLEYKAARYGSTVQVVDRYFPSSKTCSGCGAVNGQLTLSDREWICAECGAEHDRDLNAAINVRDEAIRLSTSTPPSVRA